MSDPNNPILNSVAQDVRIVRLARTLPDRTLTDDEIAGVRQIFSEYLSKPGRSIIKVSRALGQGFSQSSLSMFLSNKNEKGDNERIARAINQFCENEARREEAKVPEEFVMTSAAELMFASARMAWTHRQLAMVTGGSGYGKSITAKALLAEFPGSLYHRVNSTSMNGTGLIVDLLTQLRIRLPHARAQQYRDLIEALKGTDRLLLIDEAHRLQASGRTLVRDILDEAEIGIVLFGTDEILETASADARLNRGQWNSRFISRVNLDSIAETTPGTPLFTADQIRAMFAKGKLKLSKDGADILGELAMLPGKGSLRLCRQIMWSISSVPELRENLITAKVVKRVLRELNPGAFELVRSVKFDTGGAATTPKMATA